MAEGKIGWPGMLAALENGEAHAARTAGKWRRFIATAIFISCLLIAAYIGWVLIELRDAWNSGQWRYFWDTLNGVWPLLALGMRFVAVDAPFARYADAARKIREAALREDEHDAPVAQEYSELLLDSSTLYESVRYGPLKRPRDGRTARPIALLCILWVIAAVIGLVLLTLSASGSTPASTQTDLITGGIVIFLLLFGIWPLVVVLRMRRSIVVTADDTGISWKQVGWRTRRRSIAWHDARAFFVVAQRKSTNWVKESTWVLMGPSGALAWMAPQEGTAQTDTLHAQFAALVAARTRLPLRDLSAFVDRMTKTKLNTEQNDAVVADAIATLKAARSHPEKAEAWLSARRSEQATEAWLSARRKEQTAKKSGLGWGCTVQLVLVGVIALIYAGGWGLEQYQPHYYEGMLAQIHAGKPLYHDDMAYDNGDWPLCAPTVDNPDRCTYEGQSYHLTGVSGRFVPAWSALMYGNAVVEGTVRQIGSADYDGVGLILRAFDDKHEMVVFFIHPTDGTWSLAHYRDVGGSSDDNWTAFENGSSRAIRTEQGAANDLLVIMAGDRYICYINGRLVLSYDDSEHVIPRTGHAGFYVNDGVTEGVFTNFAVYPAPPPPSIWSAL